MRVMWYIRMCSHLVAGTGFPALALSCVAFRHWALKLLKYHFVQRGRDLVYPGTCTVPEFRFEDLGKAVFTLVTNENCPRRRTKAPGVRIILY